MSHSELTDQELLEILQNSDSEGDLDGDAEEWENISESDQEDQQEEIPTERQFKQYNYIDLNITKLHRKNTQKVIHYKKKKLTPTIRNFVSDASGCRIDNLSDDPSALEIFEFFCTRDIMKTIVEQTNIFGNNLHTDMPITSHIKKYHPTDTEETFFLPLPFCCHK
ncbi:unnamed protein product [Acanthoscelides obtectus]|uniref:PiggyBac transposable element-derived protein domain-containing protein n=1 Tax=Acanthoscelides obtectus TaxID=200917 RepID=A0A9P0L716_ACAOB|nr:unnamed protein product [Acanthoscelides obtectus]CAK1623408.1 hypothetical protein AOBTE_LOCUS1988 [Acanthoscelides obtectus]